VQTVQYLYEGAQALGEIGNGQLTHRLLTGLSLGETIARIALNAKGSKDSAGSRIYLTDALNSVIAQLSDDAANPGQLQNSYAYSPYGESQTVGPDGTNNPNQYTSRENDPTGLMFYRARYYDPVIKQFLSEDPIRLEAGLNVRGYAGGDPISFTDPLGLAKSGQNIPVPGTNNTVRVDPAHVAGQQSHAHIHHCDKQRWDWQSQAKSSKFTKK
jgi:RHS repeat-associated protein